MKIPFEYQKTEYHCGPTSLLMMLKAYGYDCGFNQEELGYLCRTTKKGTYVNSMNEYLKFIGLKLNEINCSNVVKKELKKRNPVLTSYWTSPEDGHIAVITKIKKYRNDNIVYLNDPYYGKDWKFSFNTFRLLEPDFWRLDYKGD